MNCCILNPLGMIRYFVESSELDSKISKTIRVLSMLSTQSALDGHRFKTAPANCESFHAERVFARLGTNPPTRLTWAEFKKDYSITRIKLGSTIPYINCINQGFVHFVTFFRGLTSVKCMLKHPQANQCKSVCAHNMFYPNHRLGMQTLEDSERSRIKNVGFEHVICQSPLFEPMISVIRGTPTKCSVVLEFWIG